MNEENVKQYREEVIKYLTDPDSPGEIDFLERQMLTRTKKRLGISDILAKDIEDKLILQYAAKVENNCELILANDTEKKIESYELREQLKNDLKRLGTQAKYDSIEIVSIFNEGKTGAFVFQAKVRKNKEESLYVYKYDYFPKILKEYSVLSAGVMPIVLSPKTVSVLVEATRTTGLEGNTSPAIPTVEPAKLTFSSIV